MLDYLNSLASSPLFLGISILLVNVGSRFITHELSGNDEEYQRNIILRRLTIFAACFVGTKDIITSILLTAAFVVIAGGLFRGKGPFSQEGMQNKSEPDVRVASGLGGAVDQPAYSVDDKPMFK